eukprot:5431442-Pyramimonas_sp.AAC.1
MPQDGAKQLDWTAAPRCVQVPHITHHLSDLTTHKLAIPKRLYPLPVSNQPGASGLRAPPIRLSG